jgi:protein-disulfide isomerase
LAERPPGRLKILALVALLAAAGGLGAAVLRRIPMPAPKLDMTPVLAAVLDDAGSPRVGPANAEVTVVIFTDYRCPICRATAPALKAARDREPGLRVIYKDWPIFGAESEAEARIALAADRQGRYAQAHDALMAANGAMDEAALAAFAVTTGLDLARLQADLAAHRAEFDAQIARQAREAWSLGLEGTPGYLVGRRLYKGGLDAPRLDAAIALARKDARRD